MHSKYSNTTQDRSAASKRTIRASGSTNSVATRPHRLGDLRYSAAGFGRLWDPGVFDRLQVPLTRYHD